MSADTAQQAENSAATATRLERAPVDNSASASGSGTNTSSSHLLPVNVTYLSEDGDQGAASPQVLMQSSTTSLEQLAEATTLRWEAKANRAAARQADEAEPEDIAARRKAAKQRLEASRFQHTAELTQAQIFLSTSLDTQCRFLAHLKQDTQGQYSRLQRWIASEDMFSEGETVVDSLGALFDRYYEIHYKELQLKAEEAYCRVAVTLRDGDLKTVEGHDDSEWDSSHNKITRTLHTDPRVCTLFACFIQKAARAMRMRITDRQFAQFRDLKCNRNQFQTDVALVLSVLVRQIILDAPNLRRM